MPSCQLVDVLHVPPLGPIHWPTAARAADDTNTLAAPATTAKPTDFRIDCRSPRTVSGNEHEMSNSRAMRCCAETPPRPSTAAHYPARADCMQDFFAFLCRGVQRRGNPVCCKRYNP